MKTKKQTQPMLTLVAGLTLLSIASANNIDVSACSVDGKITNGFSRDGICWDKSTNINDRYQTGYMINSRIIIASNANSEGVSSQNYTVSKGTKITSQALIGAEQAKGNSELAKWNLLYYTADTAPVHNIPQN
ncbi:MAG: hypothetical protein ACRC6H_05865, partial [Culicoidibacterales bacterium]